MVDTSSEMFWVHSLLQEFSVHIQEAMPMYRDNQVVSFTTNNPTYHARTKHIEVDCHAIHHHIVVGLIYTPYVASSNQFTDIFTKGLSVISYDSFSCNLGLYDLYTLA